MGRTFVSFQRGAAYATGFALARSSRALFFGPEDIHDRSHAFSFRARRFASVIAAVLILAGISAAQCTLNPTSPSVTICSPANGATVTSPVSVVAGTTDNAHPVTVMRVYLDNVAVFSVSARQLSTSLTMSGGRHNITVNAWDTSGAVFKSTAIVNVSGTGTGPVSVAISPNTATLAPGQQQQFTATVLNATDTSVSWSVDGFVGGNTTVGIVDTTGLYTAGSQLGTHNVVATSVADSTKSDTAVVTVTTTSPGGGGTCSPASAAPSLTICGPVAGTTVTSPVHVQAVAASNTAVTKFLVYVDFVLAYQALNVTSIDTSLNIATGSHNLTVQFYNGAWVKKAENIVVSSAAPSVSVSINPPNATLTPNATQQFTATVQNASNTAVSWMVDGQPGGNSTVGTISGTGNTVTYTAPGTTGTHTVTATSVADTTKYASATVVVGSSPGVSISISPTSSTLSTGGTQQFTASVQNTSNTSVTWAVDGQTNGNGTVGTITGSGLTVTYTAPGSAGTHTVTVTSAADATQSASASVTVNVPSSTCSPASAAPSVTICSPAANATVTSPVQIQAAAASNTAVTKFLVYVDFNLAYQALNATSIDTSLAMAAGTHNLTIQFFNGAWVKKAENITVSSGPPVVTVNVSPSAATVAPDGTQQFTATVSNSSNTAVTWAVDGAANGNTTVGTISGTGNTVTYTAPSAAGTHTVTATSVADTTKTGSATVQVATPPPPGTANVTTYHTDLARTGANTNETILTPSNVNSNQFGKLFSLPVDGNIYAQPLYMSGLTINGARHNVVFVATENNSVYAFDADGLTTTPLWKRTVETAVANSDSQGPAPLIGITSTPVIDPATNTLYVVAETLTSGVRSWYLHALDILTGADKIAKARVNGTVAGTGKDNVNGQITLEQGCYQREGLALANGNVYIGFAHCGHGWLFAYDKNTLARVAVWNPTPNGSGGGIWMSAGAPAVDSGGNVFVITSVDFNDPLTGFPDSFMRLSPTLGVIDFFEPSNSATLAANDADLGSGGILILPDNGSSHPRELIGGGKDGQLYILNRDNLGGFNPSTGDQVVQSVHTGVQQFDNIFATPTFWDGKIYVHCEQDVLRIFSWNSTTGLISTTPAASGSKVYGEHGATSALSANGSTAGIVWEVETTNWATGGAAVLHAYDATNAQELYNSAQAGSRDTAGPAIKFQVPAVANGKVYVGTGNQLNIYGLF